MSCYCHNHEEDEGHDYDELNGYNAEDEGDDRPEVGNDVDVDADTEIDYDEYNAEYDHLYEADADKRSQLRDEIIYTIVFNNYRIPTETTMDFSLGSIEEWGLTCDTFNQSENGLTFATIYIVYDRLVCNNIHPFLEMNQLADLFHSHIIHD
jgi:hypothetical protein